MKDRKTTEETTLRYRVTNIDDFFLVFDIEETRKPEIKKRIDAGDGLYVYQDGSVVWDTGSKPEQLIDPYVDGEYPESHAFRGNAIEDGHIVEGVDHLKSGWWKAPQETQEDLLELAEKAASYKRGGNHLLEAISKVEAVVIDLFEDYSQFRFIEGCVGYVNNLMDSNVGSYGPALCYVRDHGGGHTLMKPLPEKWSNAGSGNYLHGDFRAWYDRATRVEIVKVAANLGAFLEKLAAFLQEKAGENEASAGKIDRIAVKMAATLAGLDT